MSCLYTIPLSGLKEGHHTFDFEIGNKFFDLFDESEINEGELVAVVEIEKMTSHMDLIIKISGRVKTSCDRCLELYGQPVECENRLLVRLGRVFDDSDPEIITVPSAEHELDLKHYIYEFIHLALPIQRIHPFDNEGESTCNPVMLQKLEEYLVKDEEADSDPRWNELKKLIENN